MDHAGAGTTGDAGAAGLSALLEALLQDPAVRERIEQDPELSEMWSDPDVRRHAAMAPEMIVGMSKLLELVRILVDDPAVQARIEADAALRHLWSDPGVRHRIGAAAGP